MNTAPTPEPIEPSGKIDEHLTINNELRDVNFCGKTYKVKQVMIDGVDVVQRVAEILTKNLMPETLKVGPYLPPMDEWIIVSNKNGEVSRGLCEDIQIHNVDGVISIENVEKTQNIPLENWSKENYRLRITDQSFIVGVGSADIYSISDYEGTLIGPIGKLK